MATPVGTVPEPTTRVTGYRIVQYILDLILVSVLLSGLGYLADRLVPDAGFEQVAGRGVTEFARLIANGGWSVSAALLTIAVWAVVFVAVPIWRDRTPAMMLLGLRITRVDGARPSALQHVGRAVLLVLDGAGGGFLGWIVILCSGNRQRIGDHAAGTLVVR